MLLQALLLLCRLLWAPAHAPLFLKAGASKREDSEITLSEGIALAFSPLAQLHSSDTIAGHCDSSAKLSQATHAIQNLPPCVCELMRYYQC